MHLAFSLVLAQQIPSKKPTDDQMNELLTHSDEFTAILSVHYNMYNVLHYYTRAVYVQG